MEDSYIPILMYHSISTSTNPSFERWAVPPESFDEHLSYLKQNHYTAITVTDFIKARTSGGGSLPERPVILTFDDAYADFYENAYPALQRHGFPATLYIPTAHVGGTCSWLREDGEADRPMVSWNQLAVMSANGIECGGHSHTHVQLDTLPLAAAEFEIRQSKGLLEEHLGHEIFSFAYPHGWTTGSIKRLARAAGYTSACAVKNLHSSTTDDPFALARLVVTGSTSVTNLAEMLRHRATHLEMTLRDVVRPVWRFAPRSKAWLKSHTPKATEETAAPPARQDDRQEAPVFMPAAMLDIEISQALSIAAHTATGSEYRRALALVRLHTQPIGVVELFADHDGFSAESLARRIWEAMGPKINEHLRDEELPEVSELSVAGIVCAVTPPCVEAREAFLADAPFVSVVIPTHNRPQNVVALVESILASEYPPAQYEIVVVDNAPSSNATAQIVEQRFAARSQVRYVREDRAGTSNARNCGWLNARGEIVVYADDDELVDAHWLTEMVRGFDAAEDVGGVTGLILPMESETPAQGWFEQFGGYCKEQCDRRLFNLTDHRSENPLYPYTIGSFGAGGSMAFKRSVLQNIGGFDAALGATTPTLGGEDIDGILRVILGGYALLYEPAAILRHPPYREYAQLRRQIEGYGTGLTACLFKNVVTKPHLLPEFLRKLPRGLLFAFSTRSPHHAGKQASYPRELTFLELKGLLYGPLAYLRSRRRMALIAPMSALGAYVEPQTVPVGEMR